MPRKRKAAREFRAMNNAEPRDLVGSLKYWQRRIGAARALGELPLRVARSSVRNRIALLVAMSLEERWIP